MCVGPSERGDSDKEGVHGKGTSEKRFYRQLRHLSGIVQYRTYLLFSIERIRCSMLKVVLFQQNNDLMHCRSQRRTVPVATNVCIVRAFLIGLTNDGIKFYRIDPFT